MFNPSRDEARRFLFDAWHKYRSKGVISELESLAIEHILQHPEYHTLLENPNNLERDWLPEQGESNPFLHLMLHLSITEQVSIDQPTGIRAAHQRLSIRHGDVHSAEHAIMDCLAEMIWSSQRHGSPPDATTYLHCLERKSQ